MQRVIVPGALVAALGFSGAAQAQSVDDMQGVWSFSGGQVAVQAQPDGTLLGTIIRPTTFATCAHPVGEQMWVGLRRASDGQWTGLHRWFNTSTCEVLPDRGPTAFRVLTRPDGSIFLRVCFNRPDRPSEQPSIAADGASAGVNDRCADSDPIGALRTTAPALAEIATWPSTRRVRAGAGTSRRCVSRRAFRIRLREPRGDALKTAKVLVNGKAVVVRRGTRLTAPIVLRGLPKGRFTVRIRATTVLGHTITGARRYRTCTPKVARRHRGRI